MKKNSILRFIVFVILLNVSGITECKRNQNSDERKNQINSYLLSLAQEGQGTPCTNFATSESFCIANPDSTILTCSNDEILRLKKGIEPVEKRTDEVLSVFLNCWKSCNNIFNTTETICTSGSKFPSNKAYREAQKSGSTTQSKSWGLCMNSCNKGENLEVSSTGATYPNPAY